MSENTRGLLGLDADDSEFLREMGYGDSDYVYETTFAAAGKKFRTGQDGTGLEDLEIGPGRITLIGGAPKAGKTSLATQLAYDALRIDGEINVAISNAEMSAEALYLRQVSRIATVPSTRIEKGNMSEEEERRVDGVLEHFANSKAPEHLRPPFNTATLATWADNVSGKRLLVVDYVQRFGAMDKGGLEAWRAARHRFQNGPPRRTPGIDVTPRDHERAKREYAKAKALACAGPPCINDLALVIADLRDLAAEGVAIIVVSAMSRDAYGKGGLASFRGTSELEYGCDDAFVLMQEDGDVMRLEHVASRNSEYRDRRLRFDRPYHRFTSID